MRQEVNEEQVFLAAYAKFVGTRAKTMPSTTERLLHGAVGISGEAGELLDAIKKVWVYGAPVDKTHIREEIGDIMYYIHIILNEYNWNLAAIMDENIAKLTKRYPEGFTKEAAIARADKQGGRE